MAIGICLFTIPISFDRPLRDLSSEKSDSAAAAESFAIIESGGKSCVKRDFNQVYKPINLSLAARYKREIIDRIEQSP